MKEKLLAKLGELYARMKEMRDQMSGGNWDNTAEANWEALNKDYTETKREIDRLERFDEFERNVTESREKLTESQSVTPDQIMEAQFRQSEQVAQQRESRSSARSQREEEYVSRSQRLGNPFEKRQQFFDMHTDAGDVTITAKVLENTRFPAIRSYGLLQIIWPGGKTALIAGYAILKKVGAIKGDHGGILTQELAFEFDGKPEFNKPISGGGA